MLEGAPKYKPESRDRYSNRVSAINKQSINLLKSINAWDFIESVRNKPIMEMQVSLAVYSKQYVVK
jgi:ubiquinone biosynthesis monooxygenase Coq6